MTLQLELKPETERTLRAAAEARQVPVEEYLLSLVESALHPSIIPARNPSGSREEFERNLKKLSEIAGPIPNHPGQTWSREVIYDDHD
jgi:hypothetical protein